MKDRQNILRIIIAAMIVVTIAYFVFNSSGKQHFQWMESYKSNSDQPYGTLFLRKMLESYHPQGKFVYNTKKSVHVILDSLKNISDTQYIFVGQSEYLDEYDIDALVNFIHRGNDVFIASLQSPVELISRVHKNNCSPVLAYSEVEEKEVLLNFYHDSLKANHGYRYSYRFAGEEIPYYWNFIDKGTFCDSTDVIVPIGYQSDPAFVNFLKIPYGEGSLYLHTNPIAFTNLYLIQEEKLAYASGVFSHIKGENIIWDEYSKIPFSENNNIYNSPLYFILQQPSLKHAWWMMLGCIGLFIFFAAKRRQRIIPVVEAKTNTSLEFVNMISSLHYQNEDHLDMARKKMKYFLYFIRAKYGIQTPAIMQVHVALLSEKSKVNESDVQNIFDRWNVIDKFGGSSIEDQRLTDLYFAIDHFYKNCR